MTTRSQFESLRVWHDARALVVKLYAVTGSADFARDLGLRDQLRRAAISVMSNIAEGHERGGSKDFCHFLTIARASCGEMRSQLYAAEDIGYLPADEAAKLRGATAMLSRRIAALSATRSRGKLSSG